MTIKWETPLRQTADKKDFPYMGNLVTFIKFSPDKLMITQAKGVAEKKAILQAAGPTDVILAAWPGKFSQDVFVIADPKKVLAEVFLSEEEKAFNRYLYEEMDQAGKKQAENLAALLERYRGRCSMFVDNDNWQIIQTPPEGYGDWPEEKQDEWYETEGMIADNHNFPDLGISHGLGVLEALALSAMIKLEYA